MPPFQGSIATTISAESKESVVPSTIHHPLSAAMQPPPEIIQLPEMVANQIAAGEVLERPAAAVKELAENSLDAGATRILVRIADGGRRLVEVIDDGHGMRPEDLRKALGRHATSKLKEPDDLFRIATLGFRGEALPSIAAVSEFELASRPHGERHGQLLALTGGTEAAFAPCAMAEGTRVSVRNLFWNVPARLKFLKGEQAETGHVTDQVMRLSLSHPRVAFRLEVDDRTAIDLPPGQTLGDRVRALFGAGLAESLLPVTAQADRVQLEGFVAHPREARPTAKRQFVFLNGRYVRDRLLIAAVREGFNGFMEPRLHGSLFLHLDLDPSLVDVNVHPTKSEVRFRREGEIFALVRNALKTVLTANMGGFSLLTPEDAAAHQAAGTPGVRREIVKPAAVPAAPIVVTQERFLPVSEPAPAPTLAAPLRAAEPAVVYQTPTPGLTTTLAPLPPRSPAQPAPPGPSGLPPGIRRIQQVHDMYLLIESDRGLRLIDQHALHEKALLTLMRPEAYDLVAGGVQELLVPKAIELSAAEIALVEPLLPALWRFGIGLEVFGPTTLLLRAHPARLGRTDWAAFITDLAGDGDAPKATAKLEERISHRLACRAAVKAGQRLSDDEQRELVALLYRLEGLEHCPHGRPTTLDLDWTELARRFQR